MNDTPLLDGQNLTKKFPAKTGHQPLVVLDDISISISPGSVSCVIGASGSGKSTLLHILGGLDKPDSGQVLWKQEPMYAMQDDERAQFRNLELGFVFQFHHLLPEFDAIENVMMPALIQGMPTEQAREKAHALLQRFGIAPRANHRPAELSGGEQQRVSMARALINGPSLILADEPTGNLDEANTSVLLDLLFDLRTVDDVSILLITHEKEIADQTDRTYRLSKGKLSAF